MASATGPLSKKFWELDLEYAEFVVPRVAHDPEVEAAFLLVIPSRCTERFKPLNLGFRVVGFQVIPLPVVFDIASKIPARWRALVPLATFAQMRFGELAGLARDRLDLDHCEVRITEALVQPDKGGLIVEPSKSRAGKRALSFPAELVPELRAHLDRYAERGRHGLVFVGPKGGKLRRSNFNEIWSKACAQAGILDAHFHDLRHTGGTLSATTGATTKELMARLGHSSPRAAMIYQHATRDRNKSIAAGLGKLLDAARDDSK